jgi:hypothetical protein
MVCKDCVQSDYWDGRSKAIPLQAWTGPEGSGRLSTQTSWHSAHEGGKVVSPTHQPPLPPRKYSWYSFPLEAESTPGSKSAASRIMSIKDSSDTIGNQTHDLLVCNAVLKPTAPRRASRMVEIVLCYSRLSMFVGSHIMFSLIHSKVIVWTAV